MSDFWAVAVVTTAYSAGAGVLGWFATYALRRRSLRVTTIAVALVAVAVFVAGLVGTSRAMLLSSHDLSVVTEVSVVAGLVSLVFAVVVGETLVRRSRTLQREARAFGESGTFDSTTTHGPAELTELARELERTSQRLRAAQDRERRLETSRRELVAWVSHDLRTPLAGLRAMAEALEDGMVDDPARYHARIRDEVERLGRMVDDLFELSRIHAGAFEVSAEQVLLGDLVSESLAGADPIARAHGVRLDGTVEDGVLVDVDPGGMSRVLLNLLTNAIRHTPDDGTVQVVATTDGDVVELRVSDACGGIPEDEIGRVFDVAWRGSAARSPDRVGTGAGAGLGLAIVRGIVEAHRGSVQVVNREPGCVFLVQIPVGQVVRSPG